MQFHEIGRLPAPNDNVAIATRRLDAGLEIEFEDRRFRLSHTVLEGHRFAVQPIEEGGRLYSWEMPFGTAVRRIEAGDYVCNAGVIEALSGRDIDFNLPEYPNFVDEIPPFVFDANGLEPARQVRDDEEDLFFQGFDRGRRGVGTRNFIVVMAASSRASGFVRRLADECGDFAESFSNIDGIVPVAHTEGDDERQFNEELVLRTLAGFFVHPNVGAVLVVDFPDASVNNRKLQKYLESHDYPFADILHGYISLHGNLEGHLAEGKSEIVSWLKAVDRAERTKQPISHLNIALQCGGSDAFSGVSGNPLAAWVARAIIRQGGRANLAETDELIGAESYILQQVRDRETAERFLYVKNRFVELAERHGSSAAGNPSGGNKYRGLYNIYLKSLGAAMKRHPEVCLDYVIEYGEPMKEPGYYFMDSPGNDLESIAGQVASGGNVIFFVTGNGSITNFPFVPTVKIVTTSRRYELLKREMDVNAGAYLDGAPMDALGEEMLALTLDIASGRRSVGEEAGHAQVQLWRNWKIGNGIGRVDDPGSRLLDGIPLSVPTFSSVRKVLDSAITRPQFGLILPTSLCSGQVAKMAADRLNATDLASSLGVDRFVSLVHTEGCGVSSGPTEDLFIRTMTGYLVHPSVRYAFLLEHGCEKTHNDFFSRYLASHAVETGRFGWASIQRDGGIENALHIIEEWFREKTTSQAPESVDQGALRVGLIFAEKPADETAALLAETFSTIVGSGGSCVIAQSSTDLIEPLNAALRVETNAGPTLNYGQRMELPGYHLMAAPSTHVQETIAGLGATGVDVIVVVSERIVAAGHPFIPVLQIASSERPDVDFLVRDGAGQLVVRLADAVEGRYISHCQRFGLVDFQMSRGWRGVSL